MKGWPENGKSGPGATGVLRSNCVKTGSLKKCCFLKGGQKVGNQDLEAPGAQKQLCNARLIKKVLFWKGGQKMGNQDLEPPGGQETIV